MSCFKIRVKSPFSVIKDVFAYGFLYHDEGLQIRSPVNDRTGMLASEKSKFLSLTLEGRVILSFEPCFSCPRERGVAIPSFYLIIVRQIDPSASLPGFPWPCRRPPNLPDAYGSWPFHIGAGSLGRCRRHWFWHPILVHP